MHDKLYQLVSSLSKNEKAFFKRYSKLSSDKADKAYVKLYYAIESLKSYSENAIRGRLNGEKFLDYLPTQKNYLYELILESLVVSRATKKRPSKVLNILEKSIILIDKNLFRQASQKLLRAKSLAYEMDRLDLVGIIITQQIIVATKSIKKGHSKKIHELFLEEQNVAKQLINISEYGLLISRIEQILEQQKASPSTTIRELEKILSSPLLQNESRALTIRAKSQYYFILSSIYFQLNYTSRQRETFRQAVQFIQSNYNLLSVPYKASLLGNATLFSARHFFDRDFEHQLAVLKKLETKKVYEKAFVFGVQYKSILFYQIKRKSTDHCLDLVDEIAAGVKRYGALLFSSTRSSLENLCAIALVNAQRYQQALENINNWLDMQKTAIKNEYYWLMKLLFVICHYELGHYKLLSSELRTIRRHLSKSGILSSRENLIIKTFRSLINSNAYEKRKLFAYLQKNLNQDKNKACLNIAPFDFDHYLSLKCKHHLIKPSTENKIGAASQ